MEFVVGTQNILPKNLLSRMADFRYRVFVDMLGWKLPCEVGRELDQFDRDDTLYVMALRDGEMTGMARLLPTQRPYLLAEVFPQLMGEEALPSDASVWELSRFSAVDTALSGVGAQRQFSSPLAVALMQCVLLHAAQRGVRSLITVSPMGVERLLRRSGFCVRRAAAPVRVGGHLLFACWIEVPVIACGSGQPVLPYS